MQAAAQIVCNKWQGVSLGCGRFPHRRAHPRMRHPVAGAPPPCALDGKGGAQRTGGCVQLLQILRHVVRQHSVWKVYDLQVASKTLQTRPSEHSLQSCAPQAWCQLAGGKLFVKSAALMTRTRIGQWKWLCFLREQ